MNKRPKMILPLHLFAAMEAVGDLPSNDPAPKSVFKRVSEWTKKQIEKSRIASERASEWNKSHRDSRQVRRRKLRMKAFAEISHQYPGELRRHRRRMAFNRVRNLARKVA